MGKIILMILGLAAFGGYSLMEKMVSPEQAQALQSSSNGPGLLATVGDYALTSVTDLAGLKATALPGDGCLPAVLPQENIDTILSLLTEPQQTVLRPWLDFGANSLAKVQGYVGTEGVGLCFPEQNRVIMLPQETLDAIKPLLAPTR